MKWTLIFTLVLSLASRLACADLGQLPEKKKGKFVQTLARTVAQQGAKLPKWVTEAQHPGAKLRQYSQDKHSQVYGMAWSGKRHPEFRSLLGPYTQEYDDALSAIKTETHQRVRGRSRFIQTEHLNIYLQGHARNMWGRITVPSLMPEGVKEDEIQ